jgi:hypothetical protein
MHWNRLFSNSLVKKDKVRKKMKKDKVENFSTVENFIHWGGEIFNL